MLLGLFPPKCLANSRLVMSDIMGCFSVVFCKGHKRVSWDEVSDTMECSPVVSYEDAQIPSARFVSMMIIVRKAQLRLCMTV